MIDIFKDIKKQAKDIIAKNKVLFIPSIIFVLLSGLVSITRPLWTDYCSTTVAFIITQLSAIVLFPLSMGYIKALFQVKEGESFKYSEMFSIYRSPALLLKSFGLIMITDVLMSIAYFVYTNFIQEYIEIHNLAFVSIILWLVFFIISMLIYLYLFLANYLFVLKPDLDLIQIIKQSIALMSGKVMDLIGLSFSFILWYIPLGIIVSAIVMLKNKISPEYFMYYGTLYLYLGCVALYVALTFLIFAQKIINGEHYDSTPIEGKVLDCQGMIHGRHFICEISDDGDEPKIDDYIDEALENKRIQFENNQRMEPESMTFTDTTENLDSYNIALQYDNFELYYFLKEYGKIRGLFVKAFSEAAHYYDSYNLENSAENNIILNDNNFRLVASVNQNISNEKYEMKFEFFINEKCDNE